MHRTVPVTTALYHYLYPRPSANDPSNFSNHLARNLIPEIRCETARFYGSLDTTEARYPGLNYTSIPHIRRLSHFPHHARLFRAIKALGITDSEVLDMARWEGTLWARERFEKDEGTIVADTTGDEIVDWIDPRRAKKPAIVAVTTTTQTTVPRTRPFPEPVSSTHCELEVQEPEPDRTTMTASPAQMEDGDSTSPTATSSHASVNRDDALSPTLAGPAQEIFEQMMAGIDQIIPVLSQFRRGERVNIYAGVEAWADELCTNWTALQESGGLEGTSMTGVRELILRRIQGLQEHMPVSLDLTGTLSMVVEDNLFLSRSREEGHAVGGSARETARVITQPAA